MSLHSAYGVQPMSLHPSVPSFYAGIKTFGGILNASAKLFCFAHYLLEGRGCQTLRGMKMPVCQMA